MIEFAASIRKGAFSLDLAFRAGAGITGISGPSGAGKSTILRLIAGLERPVSGRIVIGGRVLLDSEARIFVPTHQRRIGLVLQDALLFPHLNVGRNLSYARRRGASDLAAPSLEEVSEKLAIGHLLTRRVTGLSGGEAQRVALARALLSSPRMLLLDEPLASLDEARKAEILPFIARINRDFAVPILYVSHSAAELAALCETIIKIGGS